MAYLIVKGLQPNVRTYTVMISGFCRKGLVCEAKQLFLKMETSGCSQNNVTYNVILQRYLKSKHYYEVKMLLEEMNRRGFKIDASALLLLHGQIAARTLDAIPLELLNEPVPKELMEAAKSAETVKSGAQFEGFFSWNYEKNYHACLQVFFLQTSDKKPLILCRYGISDQTVYLLKNKQHLSVKGLQLDVRTYTVMIRDFCREGLVREAKGLFMKMQHSGCPPNGVTYNVILQGYLKNKHFDEIELLLREMNGRGFSLDVSSLWMLIDQIAARKLDTIPLMLINKLVPKELMDDV